MSINDATRATESPVPAGTPANRTSKPTAKPATTFVSESSDVTLAVMIGRILAGMTANPAYPNPLPPLAELAAARDDFIVAVNGNDRGGFAIAARDKARGQLEGVARDLSLYVAQHCRGDLVTLLSSGFPARRTRGARTQIAPPTPGELLVRQGRFSGQIVGRCGRVEGALLYQWRYATVQAPTVYTVTDTGSGLRVRFEGLVPGTQYLVQVRANGRRGSSDWSDPVAVFAV
ncbi:MAG TPA: fibronectin type III domain-containing protein [Polyangia bacterium]|jgi:hypothetical protein|nr:fibronectin type III domain-containing protein [Polyangia bacterium]